METIKRYLQCIDNDAADIQRTFFKNERYFDRHPETEGLNLDNATGSGGTYDLFWHIFREPDKQKATEEIGYLRDYYKRIQAITERHGYGPRAAMMGFNMSAPFGTLWTRSTMALIELDRVETKLNSINF